MKKITEAKASTVELAVEDALKQLGTTRDKVQVDILSKGGLFSKAEVRVTVLDNAADAAEELANGILERMGLKCRGTAEEKDGTLYVEIKGEDSGTAIGYRGEALDALQYLLLTYLNQEKFDFKKVVVDSENYREKRKETLTALALRLAEKAQRTCRKVSLEPMNPFERRIIHSALADSEIATTESEGEDFDRHVVIIPKGVEIREDRAPRDDRRRDERNRSDRGRGEKERSGRRDERRSDDRRREEKNYSGERRGTAHAPRAEIEEIPDGTVHRGYFTGEGMEDDGFIKPAAKAGPPKFKSFGGTKIR